MIYNKEILDIVLSFGIALILSMFFSPLAVYFTNILGVVAVPNKRSIHKKQTPTMGGIAIYFAMTISIIFFANFRFSIEKLFLILGITVIEGMSIVDDYKHLKARPRLIILFVLAILSSLGFMNYYLDWNILDGGWGFQLLAFVIIIFWIVGITNATNFIDGMDGLLCNLTIVSLISFAAIFIIQDRTQLALILTLATLGAVIGFFPYNRNEAMIFMGDAGSMLIGFMISFLSIIMVARSNSYLSAVIPVYLIFVPIMDLMTSVMRRLIMKKSIFKADKMHFHHLLAKKYNSHIAIVSILTSVQLVLCIIGILIVFFQVYILGWILMGIMIVATLIVFSIIYKKLPETQKV